MFTHFFKHALFICSLANAAKNFKHEGYILPKYEGYLLAKIQPMGRISYNHPKNTDITIWQDIAELLNGIPFF